MRGAKVIHHNSEVLLATEKDEGEYTYIVQGEAWLSALCWCRQEIVGAQQVEVKAGLTRSCGRAPCRNPLTLEQEVGLACGPATYAVLASGLLCTEAPASKLTPKIVASTPNAARLANGLDEPVHLRNKVIAGERRRARVPRARAYRAPRRATTGKTAKRANQSRADVALRRDIVQLCWEAGMRPKDITADLGTLPYQTIVNDLRWLAEQGRIMRPTKNRPVR